MEATDDIAFTFLPPESIQSSTLLRQLAQAEQRAHSARFIHRRKRLLQQHQKDEAQQRLSSSRKERKLDIISARPLLPLDHAVTAAISHEEARAQYALKGNRAASRIEPKNDE